MAEETQTPTLEPDVFDVAEWLAGTSYSGKKTEIFNKGQELGELAELLEFIEKQEALAEQQRRNLTKPIAPRGIADEVEDVDTLVSEAREKADAILESLRGTGATFYVTGIAPEVRKVMEDKIARSLKPSPAVYEGEGEEKVLIVPAEMAGRNHTGFNEKLETTLIAASIQKVEQGTKTSTKKWTADEVLELKGKLYGPEYRRLANAVFEVNYLSYDIDSKVTLDFS